MVKRFLDGEAVTLLISPTYNGEPILNIVEARFNLIDDNGVILLTDQPALVEDTENGKIITVEIPGAENTVIGLSPTSARTASITATDENGRDYPIRESYLISRNVTLVEGTNSIFNYTRFLAVYDEMPEGPLASATELEQVRALYAAFRNMDKLLYSLPPRFRGGQVLGQLTADKLRQLSESHPREYKQLCVAQIVEAEGVLGAYPVEDRRRADLISESAGESARFFRTSRPIRLPVYRETIEALRGLVSWRSDCQAVEI